jgi:hypothetical protein
MGGPVYRLDLRPLPTCTVPVLKELLRANHLRGVRVEELARPDVCDIRCHPVGQPPAWCNARPSARDRPRKRNTRQPATSRVPGG